MDLTEELQHSTSADGFLGIILSFCFVIGTTGNIFAFYYFISSRRDLPTTIYILMTIVDFTASFTVFPVITELFSNRKGLLQNYIVVCNIWGFIWSIIPYISVFLVLVLSTLRTLSLMSPFSSVPKKIPLILFGVYTVLLILRVAIPLLMGYFKFVYYKPELHCMEESTKLLDNNKALYNKILGFKVLFNLFGLAIPLIPVILTAILSCWSVWISQKKCVTPIKAKSTPALPEFTTTISRKVKRDLPQESSDSAPTTTTIVKQQQNVQKRATVTILILTFSYIMFNVPVFIVYVVFTVWWTKDFGKGMFDGYFAEQYLWGLVYVVLVVFNAAVNPIVYIWRVKKMRKFYWYKFVKLKYILSGKEDENIPTITCLSETTNRQSSVAANSVNLTPRVYRDNALNLVLETASITTSLRSRFTTPDLSRDPSSDGSNDITVIAVNEKAEKSSVAAVNSCNDDVIGSDVPREARI